MNKIVYIVGGGGFGREMRSAIMSHGWNFKGYIDDDKDKPLVKHTINEMRLLNERTDVQLLVAVGSGSIRQSIVQRLPEWVSYSEFIHESALFQDRASVILSKGSIICAASVFTCDIFIGKFSVINLNCTIGHDVKIGNYCSLMPAVNLSGNVNLEEGVFIGSGASVLQGVTIGSGSVIGAGAVVTENIPPNCTAVGVPARPLKFH